MTSAVQRIVVIGGGVSGLSAARAAWEAERRPGESREVVLIEKEAELGGKARSVRTGDWLVEEGPTGYLDEDGVLTGWAEELGLDPVVAQDAAARRFLFLKGRLREIRPHPLHFLRSGILGPTGLLRIATEPWRKPATSEDETVWEFAARRLGPQAADRMIAPMVLGVFAGDAKRLSLPAAFPRLHKLEREHGSLIRGMKALRKKRRQKGIAIGPSGKLTSFAEGVQQLLCTIGERSGFTVRCSTEVQDLERTADGFRVVLGDQEPLSADRVVLAGEPWAQARLLANCAPKIATLLDEIPCPPVAVVALGYEAAALEMVPRGFGALIPRGQGYRILGCLWDNHLFPGRAPDGHLLIRVMVGGAVDPEAANLEADALVEIVKGELARLFHWNHQPVFQHVKRWPRAIPQYELGHLDRVSRIEAHLKDVPGLFLAGNGLHGVSFPKAAVTGKTAGEQAAAFLG